MDDEQPIETIETPKPKKPKRVKMANTRPGNGLVGGIAQPWEKDVPVWEQAGWVRA